MALYVVDGRLTAVLRREADRAAVRLLLRATEISPTRSIPELELPPAPLPGT